MYEPSYANLLTRSISLTNGAPGPTVAIPGVASKNFIVVSVVVSTNDTAAPLVTIVDVSAAPLAIWKGYVSNTQPTSAFVQYAKAAAGQNITASAAAVTAAKTVEITLTGYYMPA